MSTQTSVKTSSITLKGSAQIVTEFFGYCINSILYQRGVYDPESIARVKKYGLMLQITTDENLSTYLKQILKQLLGWLSQGEVKKVVLVLMDLNTQEPLERWTFDIETDEAYINDPTLTSEKSPVEIQREISAIMRQISASVTYLPLFESPVSFDILIYTKSETQFPSTWDISDPHYITMSNEVNLRSFNTKIHSIKPSVSYKVDDE